MEPSLSSAEKRRRAQWIARCAYFGIFLIFLTVCAVAVLTTMHNEREKEGFHAIHLRKPIAFFDYSYVDAPVTKKANLSNVKQEKEN